MLSLGVADIRPSREKLSFTGESLATLWGAETIFGVGSADLPPFAEANRSGAED